ncbi:MAG: hypothetical protein ACQEQ0_09050 [Bacteroidota bacterium]
MNKLFAIVVCSVLFSCSSSQFEPVKVNLESQWDTIRPLANPDKGWYHHLIDNGTWRYEVSYVHGGACAIYRGYGFRTDGKIWGGTIEKT